MAAWGPMLAAEREAAQEKLAVAAVDAAKREEEDRRLEREDDLLNMTNVRRHVVYSTTPFVHPKW